MAKVLEKISCPVCPSSDAFVIYVDDTDNLDHAHCFSCKYWTNDLQVIKDAQEGIPVDLQQSNPTSAAQPRASTSGETTTNSLQECLSHPVRPIPDRKISQETCEKYGVRVGVDTRNGVTPVYHLYPYANEEGDIITFKKRVVSTKDMFFISSYQDPLFFGSHVVKPSGKKLFITEGELDALSLYQVLKEQSNIDWDPSVVSLPTGASNAAKIIAANLDLINGYEEIVLVFDNDGPGRKAEKEVCKLLAGKVSYVRLPEKDASDMLVKGKANDLKWLALTGAKKYQPDGILPADECWERYKNASNATCYPYPSTMPDLNEKTYGVRPGSIITITSGSGCGKTQFLREVAYHYLQTTDEKLAILSLEEDVGDTVGGLLSLHLNKRITLPDVEVSEEDERKAFNDLFSHNRVSMYDHFGGIDDDNLFSRLRYFASTGHKFIFLDHLSIIISEFASEGGERERIDQIMTKLSRFVKETGTILFLVVNLRKSDSRGVPFEQGAMPSVDDLRGSGGIKQLSWDIIGLARNQQHPDAYCANTSELAVLKCRFTGRTGHAGYLHFDDNTGRMLHTTEPPNYKIK